MDKKVTYTGGFSFLTLLGIVFLILKLVGVIGWPWWLVLLPFIIEVGFTVLFLLIMLLIFIIAALRA